MKFIIIKFGEEEIEVELDEKDPTLTELIAHKLNSYDKVSFCATKWEHPLVDKPKIYLKADNALKTFQQALEDLKKEVKEIRKQI